MPGTPPAQDFLCLRSGLQFINDFRIYGLQALLVYRPDALKDIEKLVQQEQRCCSFLQLYLVSDEDKVELMITAPADAGEDAKALFSHLIPAQ